MLILSPKAVVVLAALSQATPQVAVPDPTVPIRIGDVARQLSDQDVVKIQRIASDAGTKAWLLNGPSGQIRVFRSIEAYLAPATVTSELRRGPMVSLLSRSASTSGPGGTSAGLSGAASSAWTVDSPGRY